MGRPGGPLQALSERLARSRPGACQAAFNLPDLRAMPLDRFASEGQLLEVRVPWLDVTLWFVPEERDTERLGQEGVSRGRVWTATELMDVMASRERRRRGLRTIALAKLTFDGDIAAVIPRSEG